MKSTRRQFLKVSTLAGGGFMMGIGYPVGANGLSKTGASAAFNAYLEIAPDGQITFLLTKHEMGQGSGTGLPMILADELEADWTKIQVRRSDYDKSFSDREMGTTGGSRTIGKMWDILRMAGATAREMLKQAAAERWQVDPNQLEAKNSFVTNPKTGDKISFGDLAEVAVKLSIPKNVELKKPEAFNYIGQHIPNLITPKVVNGTSNYGIDTDVPGMVYAAVERCPYYMGELKDFDDTEARKIDGVIDIFPIPKMTPIIPQHYVREGVAVIATSTWIAFKARKLLRINWEGGVNQNGNNEVLDQTMTNQLDQKSSPVYSLGDFDDIKEKGAEIYQATYDNPYQAHALMEPINATAHFKGDTCEVWVGTQSGARVTQEVAKVTGLPQSKVTTHVLNSGGSFGRRFYADSSMEAAYISKRIRKPVKLTWSREDEIQHDYFHPYQKSRHTVVINENDIITGWETSMISVIRNFDGDHGFEIPYDFQNIRTYAQSMNSIVPTGAWRSVINHSSALGRESFVDELAIRLNKDPLALRSELIQKDVIYLGNQRAFNYRKNHRIKLRRILNFIQEKELWNMDLKEGEGKGLAIDTFFSGTVCAQIALVRADSKNRAGFKVNKVLCVVDCGTVINPHFGRGQIEGSIIWGLTALLYGGVEVENGRVKRSNFHDNKILRIDEVPEIDTWFIESSDPPTGLGEPGTPPLAPAVLNALYDATGKRVRKIPVTKNDLI